MKNITLIFLTVISVNIIAQNKTINGIVKDVETKQPIPFGSIVIIGTSIGTNTNESGKFSIEIPNNIMAKKLFISYVGYKTDTINLTEKTEYHILLKPVSSVLNEVTVTGVTKATLIKENPLSMAVISSKQITTATENNVVDAISKNAPGFFSVKTGPNVSKPFINGLGYNRVLTSYDGMRVETQQWGDEHGVPIDDYAVERAEVIKGPASLMYGSDAIAGVLSLFTYMPKDTDKTLHGSFLSEYQSNNGLIGNSLYLSYGSKHWAYSVRGSERIAKNYSDAVDGRVYNTNFRMANASAFVGYTNEKGYTHINAAIYTNLQGIPDGTRDSATRQFTYQVYEAPQENTINPNVDDLKNRQLCTQTMLNSYALSPLHQSIQDYKVYSDNYYKLGAGHIKAFLGAEQNFRREFDHPTDVTQAGMYVRLNSLYYSLCYDLPTLAGIDISAGVNGMYQNNKNMNATDFPIPNYNLFDAGAYVFGKWKYKKWTIAGGMRYDHRTDNAQAMYIKPDAQGFYQQTNDTTGSTKQFSAFTKNFQGITGSLGFTRYIGNNISLKANVARGYRAPNISELASNGLDPGAHIVYLGKLDALPEFSLQEDMGLSGQFKWISFEAGIFNNNIQNFLYEAQKVDEQGNPVVVVQGNRTYQYQQTNAQLYGANGGFRIFPEKLKGFDFSNSFSCVYGFNLNPIYKNKGTQGEYLPFIPPPHWLSVLSQSFYPKSKIINSVTLKIEADVNAAQNRYLALDNTETATAAYTLFNVGFQTSIAYSKKYSLQFQFSVNNLFNTAYQNHLSRLQYFEYYSYSPNGKYGIYNMGRNFCFKVIFSF